MSRLIRSLCAAIGAVALMNFSAAGTRAADDPSTMPNDGPITVLSPRELQVVQRETKFAGHVVVSGRVKEDCDKVEVHFAGKDMGGKDLPDQWSEVPYAAASKSFFGKVQVPAGGWYAVEVRASKGGKPVGETVKVDKVGVGEVFVIAGQSNSTNSGQFPIKQSSGMVSSFSGLFWRLADDPQPGTHDKGKGGSPWPAFGDAMYARFKVPIGIASTGFGGTSTTQWQPDAKEELFPWFMTRVYELGPGGFRAVLWHQGESDAIGNVSTDDYVARLSNVIKQSTQRAGWQFPWFVAQVSYINPDKVKVDAIRDAQKEIWDAGVALEGPDTDTLTGDSRDHDGKGIHFSPKGLKTHGEMWAEKVGAYLDKLLAE
jgi:hypothetical protein